MSGILNRRGPLSKIVGGGIGMAKEYSADRKARKEGGEGEGSEQAQDSSRLQAPGRNVNDYSSGEESEDDEAWAQDLDEAEQDAMSELTPGGTQQSEDRIIADFLSKHPPPPYEQQIPSGRLSMPVILPQRRPESRHRGFVRAYAPVLEDAGIDQQTWLDFLDGFEKSINNNGWFHAVNIAVWVADKAFVAVQGISLIARAVTMTIHLGVESGRRAYVHGKHNGYLDKMNEQFFKPRGLYCLIFKYKPKSNEPEEEVDMQKNITETVSKRDGPQSKWKKYFSSSAGKTEHEEELPEFAPLVFPGLDNLNEGQKQSAMKRFGGFVTDYYDRQAQAKFDGINPDSKLAGVTPRKDFASPYSDPNSTVSQGGLISIATQGKSNPTGRLSKLRDRRGARREKSGINRPGGREGRKQRRNNRGMKRLLKTDTLYLMVVNMPTQEEMDRVMAEVERAN